MQLGEIAKSNPEVAIGSYPFFDSQHGANTNVVLRARDAQKLAQAKRVVEDMLERVRQAQSLLGVTSAGAGSRPVGAAPTPTWLMNCCVPCHGGFGGTSDEPGTSQASVRWTNCERREARKRDAAIAGDRMTVWG
jgi:hypothetical protein